MTQVIDRCTATNADVKRLLSGVEEPKATGPAMAALLSSGIGVAVLGVFTTVAAASTDFRET